METLEYVLITARGAVQWIPHPKLPDLASSVPLEILAAGLLVLLVSVILLNRR